MEYRGLQLDPFQVEAIEHIQENRSVLVSAPTGTGKTIIADYIVEQALGLQQEVIYTAPVKALSNQKYRDYCRLYGEDSVGLITGDLVIRRDAPLRIMTTEILRNMLLSDEELPNLSYVIIDEIHFLDDIERGTVWEEVLIYLPARVKILGLSATLANIREFASWLSHVRNEDVHVVTEERRHVPLEIFLANREVGIVEPENYELGHRSWTKKAHKAMTELAKADARRKRRGSGGGRHRAGKGHHRRGRGRSNRLHMPGEKETRHHELVGMLGPEMRPILYFAFSRKLCEQFSRELLRRSTEEGYTTKAQKELIKATVDAFDLEHPKVMTSEQENMYLAGIAFHHAGLHVALKAFVEDLYERKLIRVLYCTSTFALGINMPAKTVCFQELRKYDGRGVVPLTVRQFMQKAGRAGRRGLDEVGHVVIRQEFSDYERDREAIKNYLQGAHEQVRSAFNLSFNSVVNLLDRHGHDLDEIREVIDKSFLNFHYVQRGRRNRQRLRDIQHGLARDGWDPNDPEAGKPPRQLMGRAKKLRKLQKSMTKDEGRVFSHFLDKVSLLQSIDYLEEDLGFNAGARVLKHLQIEEIFSTELVLSGILDPLPADLLFGALCALANSFSRATVVRERPRGPSAKLAKSMRQIRYGDAVRSAEGLSGLPVTFTAEMIPFGEAWVQGRSLNELLLMIESPTDLSGDLVSAFRRAKDMATQLKRVYSDDAYMTAKLKEILVAVSRDEVEVVD